VPVKLTNIQKHKGCT